MLRPGHTFARYVIEASIGQGGMGEVYRAFDEKLRRKVALKVIHPDVEVPDAAKRLVREARVAAGLAHPNTIAIFDLGEIDGTVFLVMELVSGSPLRAYIGDPSIPVARKLRWLADIARGLHAAHKAGLVHRDVKPANVMVSDDDVVKVLDFGLAKPLEAASFRSDVGVVVGTVGYLAPELFTGAPADARSDQFAFGVTAYELLAGVHPGNPMSAVPAGLDASVPGVSPAVGQILGRTLSRAPGDRYSSMGDVARALDAEIARASTIPGAAPPTRRDGRPTAGHALAHAPTELAASGAPLTGETQRRNVARTLAIIGLLLLGGGYVVARTLVDRPSGPPSPAPSASASVVVLDDASAEASPVATVLELTPDALPSAVDDSADGGDGSDDASAQDPLDAARPGLDLDDFPDPWKQRDKRNK